VPGEGGRAVERGVVVDASHGNSGKDHVRQAAVVRELAARLATGEAGISGLMMESFIEAGAQDPAPSGLVYGKSVTDKCIDWPTTADLLRGLAGSVRARRAEPAV
jgi:3-deoxy-7-phosphoheptulonate synthase